ncbi:hypothetical protein GCM10027580_09770 [Corynebacterium faecale]
MLPWPARGTWVWLIRVSLMWVATTRPEMGRAGINRIEEADNMGNPHCGVDSLKTQKVGFSR